MNKLSPDAEKEEKPQRKGIQSLVTGFQVIDFLLKTGKPVPLRDISRGTGLAASKLQFYLISLTEVGVVLQDPQSGYYGLGPYTLQLGIAGLQQFDIFKAMHPRMDDFAERHGHNIFMGVWGNHGPTIVHRVSGHSNRSILELRLGSVLPVLRSAIGRIFFAHLPEEVTKAAVDREMGETFHASAEQDPQMPFPTSLRALRDLRETIQKHGVSRSRGGLMTDHTALSAPIFDYRGKIIAGVTVMAPINALDDALDSEIALELKHMASEISQDAGQHTTHYLNI
ncbi:IclR family transcriptional regulator [Ruegeria sp.]|uniref:IclR family transcriptional regulator n=1 Tax=Ruegeria sp. TaxID=1879320 RepID=UPI003AFF801D